MANTTSNMSSGYGSYWGWWIVAIVAAIIITWWIAYAAYHNGANYGTSYNQGYNQNGAVTSGTSAPATGGGGNTNSQ